MIVISVVIQIIPQKYINIMSDLSNVPGITLLSNMANGKIVATIEGNDESSILKKTEEIMRIEGVLGVFPSYVSRD